MPTAVHTETPDVERSATLRLLEKIQRDADAYVCSACVLALPHSHPCIAGHRLIP